MGQRECQFSERVADGDYVVAHIQIVRIPQYHRCQPCGIDLQYRNIVALIVANQLCVITGSVKHRNGDRAGIVNDMMIGENIAVLGENESGTGGGGGGLVSPEVGGNRGGDTNSGANIGGINLCGGHKLFGIYSLYIDHCVGTASLLHLCSIANDLLRNVSCQPCNTGTQYAPCKGTAQTDGDKPACGIVLFFWGRGDVVDLLITRRLRINGGDLLTVLRTGRFHRVFIFLIHKHAPFLFLPSV